MHIIASLVGWVEIRQSFVGFRSSTQPTCQPFLCYQRNPTKWQRSSLISFAFYKYTLENHITQCCVKSMKQLMK